MSERTVAFFAADVIETLVHSHGAEYIDRIEQLAQQNRRFANALGYIWYRDTVPDSVWDRIVAICNELEDE